MRRNPNKPATSERILYFMVWAMALLVPILYSKMMSEEHVYLVNILTAWSKLLPYIIIFIINNSLLAPYLLFRKRYVSYVVASLLLLTSLFYALEYYQDSLRHLPYASGDMYIIQGRASFTDLAWYWNVLLGLFLLFANNGIKLMFKSMENEHRLAEVERHSLKAEMHYLKYQINPHFFMNTLNNIHALIDIDPEAAKTTVIELSKMMRYVLYESESSLIPIVNDIRFVENYIELMRIRYTDKVEVKLSVSENIPSTVQIPPLLIIVLVENAFKHGVSYNRYSFVEIDINCDKEHILCSVRNSRHPHKSSVSGASGMGLENMRKRLELLYGGSHSLRIDDSREDIYIVELSIPINND